MGGKNKESKKSCAMFSTADRGLNQHRMENLLSWLVVSIQNGTESATIGILSSEMLRC
jgi:hypothetical protein